MDATTGISWSGSTNRAPISGAGFRAAWMLSGCLIAVALFLMTRRCAGALSEPLPALLLIAVGMVMTAITCAVHLLEQGADENQLAILWSTAPEFLTIVALPLFAAAITLPGSTWPGITLLWVTVGCAELGLLVLRRNRRFQTSLPEGAVEKPWHGSSLIDQTSSFNDKEHTWLTEDELASPTQKLVYRLTPEGICVVEGWLQTNFLPGQRTAVVHVAFCPAFRETPIVEAELQDGPAGEIRPTLVLPWGVRWEVKLELAAVEPITVSIEFFGSDVPPQA
jgi:hypothetical protein